VIRSLIKPAPTTFYFWIDLLDIHLLRLQPSASGCGWMAKACQQPGSDSWHWLAKDLSPFSRVGQETG
jgi:hypothetical protein